MQESSKTIHPSSIKKQHFGSEGQDARHRSPVENIGLAVSIVLIEQVWFGCLPDVQLETRACAELAS